MSKATPSLLVQAEINTYKLGNRVMITVAAKLQDLPAPQVPLKLSVFDPAGKKVFQTSLRTDNKGKAMTSYQLKMTAQTGNYYLEAKSKNHSLALGTFIVLH